MATTPAASAASSGNPGNRKLIRVEEDWRLSLFEPESEVDAPQFYTVMSPYAGTSNLYFQVAWNHRDLPDFESGGLQLQVFSGDESFATREVGESSLSNERETVSLTQVLQTDSAHVTFSVANGFSSSWGAFGGESMTVRTYRPLTSLTCYSPSASVGNAVVVYGSNRVEQLELHEIRYIYDDGTAVTDSSPRVVFQYQDAGDYE